MDKILVNIDFKHDTAMILEKAAQLAIEHSAVVELFCCCYNRAIVQDYMFDKAGAQKAEHAYVRQIESQLEVLSDALADKGIHASFDACWDRYTDEGIMRKILRYEPDLLMHAVQPHSRIGHYLFASLDWQIARQSPVPVLFVKQKPWTTIMRIAACIDPFHKDDLQGQLDREILTQSQTFSKGGMSELRVLHCFNTLPHEAIFDEHLVTDYEALQIRIEKEHITRCNDLLAEFGLSTEDSLVDVLKGEADSLISDYAIDNHIDIIAMGGVARSVLDRLLLGSTMESVVDNVDCDVLVVKRPDFLCPLSE